jgi:A/G-specific adenine glycosylase
MKPSASTLLVWYRKFKRDLPWRQNSDPYRTWISEVMSQQTTLVVVLTRFVSFIDELPNVQSLHACPDTVLRRLWSGLGYYARARNLKKGAEYIVKECGGCFPTTYEGWRAVPGCGEYTAGMLASICFGERVPAVDGNVMRVGARVLGMGAETWQPSGKVRIRQFAQDLVSQSDSPGDCNQALIELGALVCRKHNPDCAQCPFQRVCVAFSQKRTEECPPPKPRRDAVERELFPVVFRRNKRIGVFLRTKGFLKSTRGFPLLKSLDAFREFAPLYSFIGTREFVHVITHHKLLVKPKLCDLDVGIWKRVESYLKKEGFVDVVWMDEEDVDVTMQTSLDTKAWNIVKLLT